METLSNIQKVDYRNLRPYKTFFTFELCFDFTRCEERTSDPITARFMLLLDNGDKK
jgi:hypothetical protein